MGGGMLVEESWQCPTCLDLIFKPAVNSACGHLYCFWCLHKAMSPYSPSACPVCRAQYAHLPAICAKLHRFLACQFPQQYEARRQETEAEERECGGGSPDPVAGGPLPAPPGPDHWQPLHFACDSPACGKLLCRPAVLTCGHAVCSPACLPAGGDGEPFACPACGLAARHRPAVCKQLGDLLAELFPEQSRRREQECGQAAQRQQERQQAAAAGSGDGQAQAQPQPPQAQREPATPRASAAGSAAGSTAGHGDDQAGSGGGPAADQQQQQESLSPSLVSALRRRQAAGGPGRELAERLETSLRGLGGEGYTHHGVGCDGCGLYPIQGRRYRCMDCPDAMGFDLCGACMERGFQSIVGRFDQRHTPDHRMRLVRPRLTAMHMLQAANPGMPVEQLMWLLELTLTGGDDEEQQQQPQAPHQHTGAGPAQAQVDAAAGGAVAAGGRGAGGTHQPDDEPPIPMLRRGPRPAYDATAQEPSPSAYAPRQPAAATAAAGQPQQSGAGQADQAADSSDAEAEAEVHVPLERVLGGGSGSAS